jgi:hypothetical protein
LPRSAILVTKEGEKKIIESTISPLLSSTHEIIGTVFVFGTLPTEAFRNGII